MIKERRQLTSVKQASSWKGRAAIGRWLMSGQESTCLLSDIVETEGTILLYEFKDGSVVAERDVSMWQVATEDLTPPQLQAGSGGRSATASPCRHLLRSILFLGVFGVGERTAAQIVLRFPPSAISNQVPPKNPSVRREFKVFSRFFPVLRE